MRETPDIETATEDYASRFSGAAGRYFLATQSSAVLRALNPGSSGIAIELGGGHGQLIPLLEKTDYDIIEYSSDNSCHKMLELRHPNVELNNVTGDMQVLPFADQSVDLVIFVRLIAHIDNWPTLIAESCRVSKEAIIFDYPSLFSANVLTPILFRFKKGIEKNTRDYLRFSKRQLKDELEKNGFVITVYIPQFFLPMFVHRALKGAKLLQVIEKIFRIIGMSSLFGSPVVLRADRIDKYA